MLYAAAWHGKNTDNHAVFDWKVTEAARLPPPPSSAPCEAGEATTCTLSVAHEMGATRRSSGACSART